MHLGSVRGGGRIWGRNGERRGQERRQLRGKGEPSRIGRQPAFQGLRCPLSEAGLEYSLLSQAP